MGNLSQLDQQLLLDSAPQTFRQFGVKVVACKYCLSPDLAWHNGSHGYRLYDMRGNRHECAAYSEHRKRAEEHKRHLEDESRAPAWIRAELRQKAMHRERREQLRHHKAEPAGCPTHGRRSWVSGHGGGFAGYCQACAQEEFQAAPVCPGCGTRAGFAFGTGDCGCTFDPD